MADKKYSVIVIEDDPMVAQIDRMYAEKSPELEVLGVFSNGVDALKFLENATVDLIILDYYTPHMTGKEFLTQLRREKGFESEVIMVTAETQFEEVRKMYSLGIIDYLVKPFDYSRFQKAINRFLLIKADTVKKNVNQEEIDRFFGASQSKTEDKPLVKGIQKKTLDVFMEYLNQNTNVPLTCEKITADVNLSIVTVRHYLTYLVDEGIVTSEINYSTGGRPSVIYKYRG